MLVGLVRDLDVILAERRLDLGDQLGHFVVEHLVIDEVRQSVEQVVALLALALGEHHKVLW